MADMEARVELSYLLDFYGPLLTAHRQELIRLKKEQGLPENESYHYDTPLTVEHEIQALSSAGFSRAEVLNRWGCTQTLKVFK